MVKTTSNDLPYSRFHDIPRQARLPCISKSFRESKCAPSRTAVSERTAIFFSASSFLFNLKFSLPSEIRLGSWAN